MNVLQMTPGECRGYLRELKAAQARADHMAVLDLQEWHTELLIERSRACSCQLKPATMRSPPDQHQPAIAFLLKQLLRSGFADGARFSRRLSAADAELFR